MNDGTVCFNSGQVYNGCGGNIEAQQTGEVFERAIYDLVCAPEQPTRSTSGI